MSLVGTVDMDGGHHLHISISDAAGHVTGGHVLSDHIVYTTGLHSLNTITFTFAYPITHGGKAFLGKPVNSSIMQQLKSSSEVSKEKRSAENTALSADGNGFNFLTKK